MNEFLKNKWYLFTIVLVLLINISIYVLSVNKKYDLDIYTSDNKLILYDKKTSNKRILSYNVKEESLNNKITSNNKYIVFTDKQDDTYCINYITPKNAFNGNEVTEIACNVDSHVVTDDYVYYINNDILYAYNYNDEKVRISSNVNKLYSFNKVYFLTINGGLYELDKIDNTKIASKVISVLDEYNGKLLYTKESKKERLQKIVDALYYDNDLITESMLTYNGYDDNKIHYSSISDDLLKDLIKTTGFKKEINKLENASSNSKYILYMIGSNTCGYCIKLHGVLEELVDEYGFIYNYMNYPSLSDKVKDQINNNLTEITLYPTLVITKNNEVIDVFNGYADRSVIYDFINESSDFIISDDLNYEPYIENCIYDVGNNKLDN